MNTNYDHAIRVRVDPTNPGQFFSCCGLLELADRLWGGAEGWFSSEESSFLISSTNGEECNATELIARLIDTGLAGELSPELHKERQELEKKKGVLKKEDKALTKREEERRKELGKMLRKGHIIIGKPFNLRLDWWQDDNEITPKTWAGSQEVLRIARAALTLLPDAFASPNPSDYRCVMKSVADDAEADGDKVEPFYFDARRGANALAIDIGFMPDPLKMQTVSYPAVEFLCLVGLQRFRPKPTAIRRVFDYFTWQVPLTTQVAPLAACGHLPQSCGHGYRFQIAFRTDKRNHKAFTPAIPIERSEL
ncbi:MAG: type I-U CRISPR-associated protein Cas8c [Nitrospira sp.]|nr:type I-U CRISPR-associated protein Cas8c [Nitrospira sp.]